MAKPNQTKKGKKCTMNTCTEKMKSVLSKIFTPYGVFVGKHPAPFVIIPLLIFGGLGAGLLALDEETDMEEIYFPMNSQAQKDRQTVRDTFPDFNDRFYNQFSQSETDKAVTLLFKSRTGNVLDANSSLEIEKVLDEVKSLIVDVEGKAVSYNDSCARFASRCVVVGELALTTNFQTALAAGSVTYPYWTSAGTEIDLSTFLGGAKTRSGVLVSATALKLSFKQADPVPRWQNRFEKYCEEDLDLVHSEVSYETPESLSVELDKGTKGDILIFSLTITLCCVYASVVTAGGNPVSTRGMLSFGGILAAGLGIVGSMGLLSICGVKFVNIVGVVPFLIIGIGIDDMFLMMSSWSEHIPSSASEQTPSFVPTLMGKTFATAGVGITITSLTDFLAFVIGTTSVFRSVTNFSLYAGVAVIFCYICNATFFGGCLAYHGRRVYTSRHFLTCLKTKSRKEFKEAGNPSCLAFICGGSKPSKERDDESYCEMLPRKILPKIFQNYLVCLFVIVLFLGYLAVAIYGTVNLKQGLELKNLVPKSSYYHTYLTLSDEYFPLKIPVGFVVDAETDYAGADGQRFLDLLTKVQQDSGIDPNFERCWLTYYRQSPFYNSASNHDFVPNLQMFLAAAPVFEPDVVLDDANTSVIASRCFVMSRANNDQYEMADLMVRMRDLADDSPLPVLAYHSSFVAFEQFLAVLPATLQMVGCAIAVMTAVTFFFLPHVLMVLLVVVTIIMILTGIFGFMYFWDITLSSITMIHLVMSVGFSVDFSAHVCSAYLMSESTTRHGRARDAISHAAGPIMNGASSTLVGVVLLSASDSYIFVSFFRIMLLVIVLGMLHAVLFLPAVLSLMGPANKCEPAKFDEVDQEMPERPKTPPPDYD